MIDKNIVIQYALSQVGYTEKASNKDLDDFYANSGDANYNKYSQLLDNIPGFYNYVGKNGHPWCDCFVDAIFTVCYSAPIALQLLCQPMGSAGAGCEYSAKYFEQQGRFFCSDPEPGDQIFFDYGGGISHTGIVVNVTKYAVITVEGNSDNKVQQGSYPLSASYIAGYGRPNWDIEGDPNITVPDIPEEPEQKMCDVTISLPVIEYGDESLFVKVMQTLLIGKGFSCGWYGADGEYGEQTKIAVFEFRKARGMDTSIFVCDSGMWSALLKTE